MRKLTIAAAALAAGMMTFAAYAKEAPARANAEQTAKTTSKATTKSAKRTTAKAKKGSVAVAKKSPPKKAKSAKSAKNAKGAKSSVGYPIGDIGGLKKSVSKTNAAKGSETAGGNYHSIIERYATSYGVPVSLAHAVVKVESNYRANARGSAGEVGLMQIKPATARMMGYSGSTKALFHPENNIKYGMLYLAKAYELGGGSLCQTILKYNAGHGAKRMNPTSAAYCAKVKRLGL